MRTYDKITPDGTRDILFKEYTVRQNITSAVMGQLQSRGFRPVMTPAMEFYDLFGQSRYFPQESMYKLVDGRGRLLVLRPDSTIPIARLCATRLQNEKDPLRLCYSQTAFRSEPTMRGRLDEVSQCGAELIGAKGQKADLEMLFTAQRCLAACGAGDFTLEIGHIGVFRALINELSAPESRKEEIRQLIESKSYAALGELLEGLSPVDTAQALQKLPRLFGGGEVFARAAKLSSQPEFQAALQETQNLYRQLRQAQPDLTVLVDFGLVNQAEYYTGVLFRGYLSGVGQPVLSGGRYDHLLDDFGLQKPAIGFALQIDAIADYLQKTAPLQEKGPDALVFWDENSCRTGQSLLDELCGQGLLCETSLHQSKEEAAEYAVQKGIPTLYIVEENKTTKIDGKGEPVR